MKKIFLFLMIFFPFFTLSASEIAEKNEENTKKQERVCSCNISSENETKPQIFYFAPSVGIITGMPLLFSAFVDMNGDFLVYHAEKGHNIYLGLDFGLRYIRAAEDYSADEMREHVAGFPLQVNIVFDFKRHNPQVDYISFWISGGVDLMYWQEKEWDYNMKQDVKRHFFEVSGAYGIGLDLIFRNNIVLKFGFESFQGIYPNLMIALGYRF